jgi:hypothetical protein
MRVSIYHPTKDRTSTMLPTSIVNDSLLHCASILSSLFGGATSQNSTGYYMTQAGELMEEFITVLYSNVQSVSSAQRHTLLTLCAGVKADLRQESVIIDIGEETLFI